MEIGFRIERLSSVWKLWNFVLCSKFHAMHWSLVWTVYQQSYKKPQRDLAPLIYSIHAIERRHLFTLWMFFLKYFEKRNIIEKTMPVFASGWQSFILSFSEGLFAVWCNPMWHGVTCLSVHSPHVNNFLQSISCDSQGKKLRRGVQKGGKKAIWFGALHHELVSIKVSSLCLSYIFHLSIVR